MVNLHNTSIYNTLFKAIGMGVPKRMQTRVGIWIDITKIIPTLLIFFPYTSFQGMTLIHIKHVVTMEEMVTMSSGRM